MGSALQRRGQLRFWLALLLFYGVAALAVTWPLVKDFSTSTLHAPEEFITPEGLPEGDQAFFIFALWWAGESLETPGSHPWFCPLLGAPEGVSFAYTTIVPALGMLSRLLIPFVSLIAVYNFWLLTAIVLLAWFSAMLARVLGASRAGAFLTGFLMFYPPLVQNHLGHLNIASAWVLLLTLCCYFKLQKEPRVRWGVATGLAASLTFYVSAYHTVHLMLFVGMDLLGRLWLGRGAALRSYDRVVKTGFWIALIAGWVLLSFRFIAAFQVWGVAALALISILCIDALRDRARRSAWGGFALRVLPGIALTLVCLMPYILALKFDPRLAEPFPETEISYKTFWSVQPISYMLSPRAADLLIGLMPGWDDDLTWYKLYAGDFMVFPGYVFGLLILLVCLLGRVWSRARGWIMMALIFMIFSFGPHLNWGKYPLQYESLPYLSVMMPAFVWHELPVFEGYRVFGRLGTMVYLCLAIMVGLRWHRVAYWLERRVGRRWAIGLFALICLFIVWERTNWPGLRVDARWPGVTRKVAVPEFYRQLAKVEQPLFLAEFPSVQMQFLYPLTIHRHALMNQYTSRRDPVLERRMMQSPFLWMLYSYKVKPAWLDHLSPPPVNPMQVRRDFLKLGLDGIIIHPGQVEPDELEHFESICENLLGLEMRWHSPEIIFYAQPGRALLPAADAVEK